MHNLEASAFDATSSKEQHLSTWLSFLGREPKTLHRGSFTARVKKFRADKQIGYNSPVNCTQLPASATGAQLGDSKMGIDVVATAKQFEKHVEGGALPENLARELQNLSPDDRLAVAKQVAWDMKQSQNANLPKIDFYDSGELKSVETTTKSGNGEFVDHTELDKKGKTRLEVKTANMKESYETSTNIEITERDEKGNVTHNFDQTIRVGNSGDIRVTYDDDTYSYDKTTGKRVKHDEKTSWGERHIDFDPKTGHEKSAIETNSKGTVQRTYDSSTGKIRQEEFVNNNNTTETVKYNSNGDKLNSELRTPNGSRLTTFSPSTGKPVHLEMRNKKGEVESSFDIVDGKYIKK